MRLFLALAGTLALAAALARAHDHDPNWISQGGFSSPVDGTGCCDLFHCAAIEHADVREVAGGLHVRGDMNYGSGDHGGPTPVDEIVPYPEVQHSRDGRYWRCKRPDGSRRCFFAPPQGM